MYCTQCGKQNKPTSRFCTGCGAALRPPSKPARGALKLFGFIINGMVVLILVGVLLFYMYYRDRWQETSGPGEFIPEMGDPSAPVTVYEYADFQCPACALFAREYLPQLEEKYIKTGKVRLIYKNFAFLGQGSIWAAEAAYCAAEQGGFWAYHDKLFANQRGENRGAFSKPNLVRFARELRLKEQDFQACLDSGRYEQKVQDEMNEGEQQQIKSTPSFIVNGQLVEGADHARLVELIEQNLHAGISIGYVNEGALGDLSLGQLRARLMKISGEKPDLILQRKNTILFANSSKVRDLTQTVKDIGRRDFTAPIAPVSRVGYVNGEKVFQGFKGTNEALEEFRRQAEAAQAELRQLQNKLKAGEISQQELEERGKQVQDELEQLDRVLTERIWDKVLQAIEYVGQQGQLDLILGRKNVLLFAKPDVVPDLSDIVIHRLHGADITSELTATLTQVPSKIGYVNTTEALEKYKETDEGVSRLRAEAQEKQDELKSLHDEFQKGWLSEDQFQRERARIQQEMLRLDLELKSQIGGVIMQATRELAEMDGYDLVLAESCILFANKEKVANLTDRVLFFLESQDRANSPQAEEYETLIICPSGCPFSWIQAAVDASHSGEIITIGPDTY